MEPAATTASTDPAPAPERSTPTWVRAIAGAACTLYAASTIAGIAGVVAAPAMLLGLAALGGVGAAAHDRRAVRPLRRPACAVLVWMLAAHLVASVADVVGVALAPLAILAASIAMTVLVVRARPQLSLTFAGAR